MIKCIDSLKTDITPSAQPTIRLWSPYFLDFIAAEGRLLICV